VATILLIDDNETLRSCLRMALEDAGHEALEAGDGAEGLRTLVGSRVDAVICDVFMAGMNGLETITQLRRCRSGLPVVAMSGGGYGGELDLLPMARALGAMSVLRKPFSREQLLEALEKALGPAPGPATRLG
jgi:CheY-like chemotaxis protein